MGRVFEKQNLLSEVFSDHPSFEGRLAALSPALSALTPDEMRRTTLGEAAMIAETEVNAFVEFVNCGATVAPRDGGQEPKQGKPDWVSELASVPSDAELDVRSMVSSGVDPLARIMDLVQPLPEGGRFVLDAPFDPLPLKGVLGGMGFMNFTEHCATDHWRIYFRREAGKKGSFGLGLSINARQGGDINPIADHLEEIDVRGLEPPGPLVAIVKKLEDPHMGNELLVRIHREPIYLLPELTERGWSLETLSREDDGQGGENYLLKITRDETR